MKTFIDSQGRTWPLRIVVSTIDAVRQDAGVDLLEILGGDLMDRLDDPVTLARVAYAICKTEAEKQGIDRDSFVDSISGDVIDQLAQALTDAIVDFLPESKRRLVQPALQMYAKMRQELMDQAVENMNPELIQKAIDELKDELSRQASSGKSTVLPESVESAQTA